MYDFTTLVPLDLSEAAAVMCLAHLWQVPETIIANLRASTTAHRRA